MNESKPWQGTRVLVTGGAGFIGSHLVDHLLAAGAEVRVLDNLRGANDRNLDQARPHIDLRIADLRDAEAVAAAVDDCEVIYNIGANASVPFSVENHDYDYRTNLGGVYHILDAAIKHGVRRIIQASTAAVYGPPEFTPVTEDHPLKPISPYGASKAAADSLLLGYALTYDFELSIARIFNTYGPRQPRYVAYDLMRKLERNPHRLEVLGTGEQRRDYAYIDDTVRALLIGGQVPVDQPLVFNISGGRTISVRELVGLILDALELHDTEVVYGLPTWKGDIDVFSGDNSVLRGLGWNPSVPLDVGLRKLAFDLGVLPWSGT